MAEAVCGETSAMSDLDTKTDNSPQQPVPAPPAFAATTQPPYVRTLFFGADGLRPGWGLVFYVAMFLILQELAVELAWSRNFGASGLWSALLEEFGRLVAAVVPSLVLASVERRSWRVYGLPVRRAFGKLFWLGSVWGFAAISLLIFVLYGVHIFTFGHVALNGARIARFTVFWAAMFLLVALFEEFLLRGYTQLTLARGIGFWPAGVVLSFTFGLIHLGNGGETWRGLLSAAFIGLFSCLTLRRTGNLWFAVGFHAAWDWGETFFYSVPDSGLVFPGHLLNSSLQGPQWLSGGSVGPEGSVLCFLVIAFTWVAFDRMYAKAGLGNDDKALPPAATANSSSLRSSE
jgi:membrane protease YdiL (CAAX protease family)